jgi:dienelactone hydrolase
MSSPAVGHWREYRVARDDGDVRVYIAHDDNPKPIVLVIHGSGCAPLITVDADGALRDTSLFQDVIGARLDALHFAMIEKRGVVPLRFSADMSQQEKLDAFERASKECTAGYLQNVTKSARVSDVMAAVRALAPQAWTRHIILIGHSEGTHVVTGVLRDLKDVEVTAAGLLASAGPIPFYSGYVARDPGDRDQFQSTFDRVRMLQRADDDVMYQGLPARRWKTFWLQSTPIEDVRDSVVPLFVAQGTRDGTTLAADLFALEAIRQQPSRALRYVVVDEGDHAFETPGKKSQVPALIDDFISWSLDAQRGTGIAVLK